MDIRVVFFETLTDPRFLNEMGVFLSIRNIQMLGVSEQELNTAPVYVRIFSEDTLKRFNLYAKLVAINTKSDLNESFLYVPKECMPPSSLYESRMNVSIEKLETVDLLEAEVVTIKLDETKVALWSEDEGEVAKRKYLLNAGITFLNQGVLMKPSTKDSVLGQVTHIYPENKTRFSAYKVTSETKVVLQGLPQNTQKVIDFQKIGGLTDVINKLREIIQIPMVYPELLNRFGIKSPRGLLMYGPPGNGKTMIARAVAQSMGANFITIELTDATSKYTGVAEQKIKEKFEAARAKGNCVIFIDEIDSIASKRKEDTPEHQIKIVSSLLSEMDGLGNKSNIFVIGATNRLNSIDTALRRPGRFDLEFEVPLPNQEARFDILTKYVNIVDKSICDENLDNSSLRLFSELTTGYSGADISLLYREAVMNAVREAISIEEQTGKIQLVKKDKDIRVRKEHFTDAIKYIRPTSMRSSDVVVNTVAWNNLLAFDRIKTKLLEVHNGLDFQYKKDEISNRWHKANLIFCGKKGSGKKTLLYSFAKEYNYEVILIDLLDLFSLPLSEASLEIESLFIKAKQISPSIVYVKNIEKIQGHRFYLFKIQNEVDKLTNRHRIVAVIEFEQFSNIPKEIVGYKGFKNMFNFLELSNFENILNTTTPTLRDLRDGSLTIGEFLSQE